MKPLRRTRNASDQGDRSHRGFIRESGKNLLAVASAAVNRLVNTKILLQGPE
jgi:hypothetical protein